MLENEQVGNAQVEAVKDRFILVEMVQVSSSNVNRIGYNSDEKVLVVEFKRGTTYAYEDTEVEEYNALLLAESVGSEFSKFSKEHKSFKKIK